MLEPCLLALCQQGLDRRDELPFLLEIGPLEMHLQEAHLLELRLQTPCQQERKRRDELPY